MWQLRLSTSSSKPLPQAALCVKTDVSVRRTRPDAEVFSTYTHATTVRLEENECFSEGIATWKMFQQRHENRFSTEDLRKVQANLKSGRSESDPALLRKQLHIAGQ